MKGLILKDLYITKNNSKFFLLFLSLFGAISIVQGENLSFLPFCVIICAACVTSSLSYDEMAKWDYTVLCMPITRRQVVKSKYLLLLIFTAFGVGFGLIVGGCSILLHSAPDFQALLLLLCISAAIALFYGAFILPVLFRFGPEKSRIVTMLFALALALCIGIAANFFDLQSMAPSSGLLYALSYLAPAAALLLLGLSYRISAHIYQKKQL